MNTGFEHIIPLFAKIRNFKTSYPTPNLLGYKYDDPICLYLSIEVRFLIHLKVEQDIILARDQIFLIHRWNGGFRHVTCFFHALVWIKRPPSVGYNRISYRTEVLQIASSFQPASYRLFYCKYTHLQKTPGPSNSRNFTFKFHEVQVGCPRERFLAITSGTRRDHVWFFQGI